jgi:hypothetical protein
MGTTYLHVYKQDIDVKNYEYSPHPLISHTQILEGSVKELINIFR